MYSAMHHYPVNYIPVCPCQLPMQRGFPHPPENFYQQPSFVDSMNRQNHSNRLRDQGRKPFVINIEEAAENNRLFRRAIWTGKHLQVTLMSIAPGEDVGLEVHDHLDQFLRIEEGQGNVQMGPRKNNLNFRRNVKEDDAIMVPAGTWHNLTNTGRRPLKLYSIYAPPEHPFGTVHQTKKEAMETEEHHESHHNNQGHHGNHRYS